MAGSPEYLPRALRTLRRQDPGLGALVERHGPPPFRRTRNAFASLVRVIVGQQLSPAAAGTIHGRLVAHYGGRLPAPGEVAATPIEVLRGVGLSNAKARSLVDLAEHFADGRLTGRRLGRWSDEQIAESLTRVRGIGPWSVDMFLLFALNRPDVLPVGDLGVRKGMQTYFDERELPDAGTMRTLAERWRPYRSAAVWYMWRVTEGGVP